jgi:hypothetical protein
MQAGTLAVSATAAKFALTTGAIFRITGADYSAAAQAALAFSTAYTVNVGTATGVFYGIPMPVQPLKAMAAIMLAQHLSAGTLAGAGIVIGVVMLLLAATGLLDWLARDFVTHGWDLRRLHRQIVTSATYRQASEMRADAMARDPGNRLLWRWTPRRLEAEAIRDTVLAVSGALDSTVGGSLLTTSNFDYVTNDQSANGVNYTAPRRSLYLPVIRNAMFGLFTAFDYPDASAPIDCRPRTVVAPQALFFMNAPFVDAAAKRIAETLAATTRDSDERVREAFRRTLARDPDAREHEESRDFLAGLERSGLAGADALTRLCHALLSTNEFVTIE